MVAAIRLTTSHLVDWDVNPVGVAHYEDGRVVKFGCGGPGSSDLIGCLRSSIPSRAVAVYCECKRPVGGVVTPEQQQFLDRKRRAGAIAFVARSVQDVLDALAGKV